MTASRCPVYAVRNHAFGPWCLFKPILFSSYSGIKMVCLGRHWNAKTYKYEATRSDYDGLPVQELPDDLKDFARRAAAEAGMTES